MNTANHRIRTRLSLHASGTGKILPRGEFFYFHIIDFATGGLLLKTEGVTPTPGSQVQLAFEVTDSAQRSIPLSLLGQVRHTKMDPAGFPTCGIHITGGETPEDGSMLDELYLERFLEASV
ncbi:MAG: PilZ domain-containing protein [Deltaproteobacteria bacterium]|nr:PilZ domain-containing protein [Deltaproteobacteria bacterium]